jgi:hypothetical protein
MATYSEIRFKNAATGEDAGTRIGGEPQWIQVEWEPECCGSPM